MNIAFLTDSYMGSPETGLVLDPFRQGVVEVLTRLGHQVTPFIVNQGYLYDRSIRPIHPDGRARLGQDVAATRPDLVLSINRAGLCPEVLELSINGFARVSAPRFASWYIDSVHTMAPELLQFGDRELVFFFGPRSASELDGAPAHLPMNRRFFLPLGVDARAFRPYPELTARADKRFNVLFLGGYFSSAPLHRLARGRNPAWYQRFVRLFEAVPSFRSYAEFEARLEAIELTGFSETERRALLSGLLASRTGLDRIRMLEVVQPLGLTLYGGGWEEVIPEHLGLLEGFAGGSIHEPALLSQLLSLSRLSINIHHRQSQLCDGLNLRVYETMATGTLLVNDLPEAMGSMFEEGVEFLSYRSGQELLERSSWALSEPEQARKIAEAGRRAVMSGHTLQHRLVELLRVIDEA